MRIAEVECDLNVNSAIAVARLNISLPDEVYELANKWRGTLNLSDICARALKDELHAAEAGKGAYSLGRVSRKLSSLERNLLKRYALADVVIHEATEPTHLRDILGEVAAEYLDRYLTDDSTLAIAGGRQLWSMVRHLKPRSLRVQITALGIAQNDPEALHAHPNTLLTLAWLLYAPRSVAHLVGSAHFKGCWQLPAAQRPYPRYFVVASCGPFSRTSPFAQLLGTKATDALISKGVEADFGYVFFDRSGAVVDVSEVLPGDHSLFAGSELELLARRKDARTILVAGGDDKLKAIACSLKHRLCNVLITDATTAGRLLEEQEAA